LSFAAPPDTRYLDALCAEIRSCEGLPAIDTIYIGGGTPTVLPPSFIEKIFDELFRHKVTADAEITVESNPGTLDAHMLGALKRMGVNRLSLGLQAWDNARLRQLGRIHTLEIFLKNWEAASAAGFDNINVDLMFALPGQSAEEWRETLERAAALGTAHISAYALTVEEGTPFGELKRRGMLPQVSDEDDRAMYADAKRILRDQGYEHYEISNFAKPGRYSRHNTNCWNRKNYIGFGLGAHSFIDERRYHNTADMKKYLDANGCRQCLAEDMVQLTEREAMSEFMFLGLRLVRGVSAENFKRRFGVPLARVFGAAVDKYAGMGLLMLEEDTVRLSDRGMDVANLVMSEFL
jgi:oxygen-independent coproporphyrinogen-3 oxidase